jgi:hypothetical protein
MDHLEACGYCPKDSEAGCGIYPDTSWVNRRGGCPHFSYRQIPRSRGEYLDGKIVSGGRVGQQKQSVNDRSYNNSKSRRKFG